MHPVARASINIYIETSIRNKCRCSFYCALLTLAPTFVAYGGFYIYWLIHPPTLDSWFESNSRRLVRYIAAGPRQHIHSGSESRGIHDLIVLSHDSVNHSIPAADWAVGRSVRLLLAQLSLPSGLVQICVKRFSFSHRHVRVYQWGLLFEEGGGGVCSFCRSVSWSAFLTDI
jgi:hypothetical protein